MFDMVQYALVYTMDKIVGEDLPVLLRSHVELIPGAALEPGSSLWQWNKPEFAAPGTEVAVEMWRGDIPVYREFPHRFRRSHHIERQAAAGFPMRDRFDKSACRKPVPVAEEIGRHDARPAPGWHQSPPLFAPHERYDPYSRVRWLRKAAALVTPALPEEAPVVRSWR